MADAATFLALTVLDSLNEQSCKPFAALTLQAMRMREQAGDERSAKPRKSALFIGESFTEHFCTSNKCRRWLLMTFKEDSPRRIGRGGALHPPNNVLVSEEGLTETWAYFCQSMFRIHQIFVKDSYKIGVTKTKTSESVQIFVFVTYPLARYPSIKPGEMIIRPNSLTKQQRNPSPSLCSLQSRARAFSASKLSMIG